MYTRCTNAEELPRAAEAREARSRPRETGSSSVVRICRRMQKLQWLSASGQLRADCIFHSWNIYDTIDSARVAFTGCAPPRIGCNGSVCRPR